MYVMCRASEREKKARTEKREIDKWRDRHIDRQRKI